MPLRFIQCCLVISLLLSFVIEARAYRVGVLHDSSEVAESWAESLQAQTVSYTKALSDSNALLQFDCLILPDSPGVPVALHAVLCKFARNGGDFIFAGGRAFSEHPTEEPFTDLIFNDAPRYQLQGNLAVRPTPSLKGENPIPERFREVSSLAAWSAVAYAFSGQSKFTPLLEVVDQRSRRKGLVAGLLYHTSGEFKGGRWLIIGVEGTDFYRDQKFRRWMIETVQSKALERVDISVQKVSIDKDGHFTKTDGSRFFVVGTNYLGPFDAKMGAFFAGEAFSEKALDIDFAKASNAGINLLRSFSFGSLETIEIPGRVTAIRNSARKHGIYLLPEIGIKNAISRGPVDLRDVSQHAAAAAAAWGDEPSVLGYDLANEPYLAQVGALSFYGKPSPIVQMRPYETGAHLMKKWWVDQQMKDTAEWVHLPEWLDEDTKRQLLAAASIWVNFLNEYEATGSTFPGLDRQLDLSKTGQYWPFLVELNKTFEFWIDAMKKPILANDPDALITIGYNTGLVALPANGKLDFLSNHIYQTPITFRDIEISLGSMNRMRQMYPDKPMILGEFGLSNGKIINGTPASYQASALWEFLHYLHAHTNDLDGCAKWLLSDWTAPYIKRHAKWWEGSGTAREQEEFGMFWFDGTQEGAPKPIVWCLKSFSAYLKSRPAPGKLRIFESENQVRVGFEYRAEQAWFFGGETIASAGIRWENSVTKVVMATWDEKAITLMSTVDMEIEVCPKLLLDKTEKSNGEWEKRSLWQGVPLRIPFG